MSNTTNKQVNAISILEQSVNEMKDRAAKRDSEGGERSMAKTVQMFNLLYGLELTEEQGWAFMVVLKMVRGSQGAYHADDYVDAAAYAALQGEAANKKFLADNSDDISEAIKAFIGNKGQAFPAAPIQGSMYMDPRQIPLNFGEEPSTCKAGNSSSCNCAI